MCSGADALRYFLLREIVFGQDGSFSFDALVQRYNSDLANGLGNLASRTLTMIRRYFKGEVPYPSAAARNAADDAMAEAADTTIAECSQFLTSTNFRAALESAWGLVGGGGQIHRGKRALGAGRKARRREPGAAGDGALYLAPRRCGL